MARIGEDRRIHRIEPAPAVPDSPEPLTRIRVVRSKSRRRCESSGGGSERKNLLHYTLQFQSHRLIADAPTAVQQDARCDCHTPCHHVRRSGRRYRDFNDFDVVPPQQGVVAAELIDARAAKGPVKKKGRAGAKKKAPAKKKAAKA